MPSREMIRPTRGKRVRMRGPGIHFVAGGTSFAGTEALKELTALLKLAKKRTRGMKTHIWRPIGEKIIQKAIKQRYRTGGLADGDPVANRWKKLSPVTLMIRAEDKRHGKSDRGGSQPIKRQSLKLQMSTKYWQGQGKNIVRVGSFLDYAPIQEFGGTIKQAIEASDQRTSVSDDGTVYYVTGRDDSGKRVRFKISALSLIDPRPAIYMNDLMISRAMTVVAEYAMRSFEDGEVSVDKIFSSAMKAT